MFQATPATGRSRASDRVDLSDGKVYTLTPGAGGVRHGLVQHIRSQIAAGTYETSERVEGAVSSLLRELWA